MIRVKPGRRSRRPEPGDSEHDDESDVDDEEDYDEDDKPGQCGLP